MLFFMVSLVTAYTSRNLIFEQRISVNLYRSNMAFEAAESGMEWLIGMLSAGRITETCVEATATTANTTFRQRYLNIDSTTGLVTPRIRSNNTPLNATCIWGDTESWVCSCPNDGPTVLATTAAAGLHPAFRVQFNVLQAIDVRPGLIQVIVNACVNGADQACLSDFSNTPRDSEGRAQNTQVLGFKNALTTPPVAALTVVGNVAGGSALAVQNTDIASGGVTIQAAGTINTTGLNLRGVPGTPGARTVVANDSSMVPDGLTLNATSLPSRAAEFQLIPAVADTTAARTEKWERVLAAPFGMLPSTYRLQPSALSMPCPDTGCQQALSNLAALNPGRVIWIVNDNGTPSNLTLELAGDIGSLPDPANAAVAGPVSLVVTGRVNVVNPAVRIFGHVYVRSFNSNPTADSWTGGGTVRGGLLIEGNLPTAAFPTVVYEQVVIDALRRSSGSFVRMPGTWRDFYQAP